jgi:hypothetical protein
MCASLLLLPWENKFEGSMRLFQIAMMVAGVSLGLIKGAPAQTLSTYGTPGLIDMPTAEIFSDGQVALTTNRFGNNVRSTLTFQVLPRIHGSFRYSIIRGFENRIIQPDRFDRSFDLHYQIVDEAPGRPAVGAGLRDFGGTGVFSGEYVVATKSFGDRFKVTGGMGWGRLAQRGSFSNPFGLILDAFDTRPNVGAGGINTTGQLDFGAWFQGPAALFGGVEYQATDRLSFQFEYSSDVYNTEVARNLIDIDIPFNFGLNYTYASGSTLRGFVIGGTEVGLQYSYTFNPKNRRVPGGFDKAPPTITKRNQAILAGWNLENDPGRASDTLQGLLEAEGITLEGFTASGNTANVRISNRRWDTGAQAVGRTARVMAQTLPGNIDIFVVTTITNDVANSYVTIRRDDLEALETDYDGAWRSLARAQINDAPATGRAGEVEGLYPKFSYGLTPYLAFSFFDPDEPLRYDLGAELFLSYAPTPGLSFNGVLRQPFTGNIADATRRSNSVLQRVRSDAVLYAQQSDLELNRLTADYIFKPREDLFGRVSAGYLENMYGGISTELLWYPIDSRVAFGVELNYVKQRDFDMHFGFQDYSVFTGHASAYYDHGNGFLTQVDVGRYLVGDWGATLGVDREFNNGFSIGGYFTLTDVPFDDFGEGSFDKGIRFTVPLTWLTGEPSRVGYSQTIQPVLRDGGARLNVSNRLYRSTRDYRATELSDGWGRFYR